MLKARIASVGMLAVALQSLWESLSGASALSECAERPKARRIHRGGRAAELWRELLVYRRVARLHFQHAGERAGAPGVLSLDYLASYYLRDFLAVVAVGT